MRASPRAASAWRSASSLAGRGWAGERLAARNTSAAGCGRAPGIASRGRTPLDCFRPARRARRWMARSSAGAAPPRPGYALRARVYRASPGSGPQLRQDARAQEAAVDGRVAVALVLDPGQSRLLRIGENLSASHARGADAPRRSPVPASSTRTAGIAERPLTPAAAQELQQKRLALIIQMMPEVPRRRPSAAGIPRSAPRALRVRCRASSRGLP